MMETGEGLRIDLQGYKQVVGEDQEPQCVEGERSSSPKRKRQVHNNLNVNNTEEVVQEEEPEHVEGKRSSSPKRKRHVQKNVIVDSTKEVVREEKPQRVEGKRGSPLKRKRQVQNNLNVDNTEELDVGPQMEKSCSPDFSEGGAWKPKPVLEWKGPNIEEGGVEGEEDLTRPEKRRKGAIKKATLETVEEDAPRQKLVDDYGTESEGDGAYGKSLSVDGESGKERDDNGDSEAEEAQNSTRTKTGKRSSKVQNKKAKRPVKERISLSTKTRAALNKANKT